jgi:DNA-directed RNA polymerase II subunit RPB1
MLESFEASVNQELNKARDVAGNTALEDLHIWNRLKAMVYAGSKGSNLNISQIMACVGQ